MTYKDVAQWALEKIKIPSKNMREKPTNTPIFIQYINYVW
jgi:hypothetical protein